MMAKRIQWLLAFLTAIGGAAILYAQNPVSISQVGTTPVTTTVPVSGTVTANAGSGTLTVGQATGTNLHIVCDSGCSSSTAPADEAAFTAGTTPQSPAGGFFQTTATNNALTNGQMGAIQLTAQRAIFSNLRNASGTEVGTSTTPLQVTLANTGANTNKLLVTPDSVALPANQSVNVSQLAGTTTDTNSGNKSAGTLRVVLATDQPQLTNKLLVTPDANSAVNVAQMNGVAVTMGNGAAGTGVQRVAVASDNTAFETQHVATASTTNAAITTNCYITSAASTNSTNCKASAGNVYGVHVTNTTTTNYFLRMYNASSAPTCSSATGFIETIPALGAAVNGGVNGRMNTVPQGYTTGIGFCLTGGGSSTDNTNAATGVYVTILYK